MMLYVRPGAHLRSLMEIACLVVPVGPCVLVWVAFARSLSLCVCAVGADGGDWTLGACVCVCARMVATRRL